MSGIITLGLWENLSQLKESQLTSRNHLQHDTGGRLYFKVQSIPHTLLYPPKKLLWSDIPQLLSG